MGNVITLPLALNQEIFQVESEIWNSTWLMHRGFERGLPPFHMSSSSHYSPLGSSSNKRQYSSPNHSQAAVHLEEVLTSSIDIRDT